MDERERRKHRRLLVDIPAELFVQGQPYPTRIKDISEDGFFVETVYFFPIGESVFLTAKDIPMKEKAGKIIHVDLSGIGGIFENK
jgi:hypothetical protein